MIKDTCNAFKDNAVTLTTKCGIPTRGTGPHTIVDLSYDRDYQMIPGIPGLFSTLEKNLRDLYKL
jgi:hypothetical protein